MMWRWRVPWSVHLRPLLLFTGSFCGRGKYEFESAFWEFMGEPSHGCEGGSEGGRGGGSGDGDGRGDVVAGCVLEDHGSRVLDVHASLFFFFLLMDIL
ncbi:hypothetical protein L1987_10169 [Smallanthus sonchifolius]|uniref:Uncharacterized protein n=1 Tax=Smallanthus sonchifolius TaxID=185202 RepID=A0ACB9JRB9_9ASTR|nr:hypothetical protein L1987_10169 [Smallanthus sonchifolius]